jgi:prepilin-type N-terminal cleavage/methylation domain-containing protein
MRRIEGFSLIEVSIVLLIMGVLASGILKGRDLIETAQIKSLVEDVQNVRLAYANYISTYSALPGDDSEASTKFSGTSNGDGDGRVSEEDANKVFDHLYAAGLLSTKTIRPKVISENNEAWLVISDPSAPSLSTKQSVTLNSKLKDTLGDITIIIEPALSEQSVKHYIKVPLG